MQGISFIHIVVIIQFTVHMTELFFTDSEMVFVNMELNTNIVFELKHTRHWCILSVLFCIPVLKSTSTIEKLNSKIKMEAHKFVSGKSKRKQSAKFMIKYIPFFTTRIIFNPYSCLLYKL